MSSFVIDTTAPTVTSILPTDNQSGISISDNISVIFSEAMDNTSVTTNTDNASCSGTLGVSSDNFSNCVQMSSAPASSNDNMTFTLNPSDNLTGGITYLTRVTTGVKDRAGNTLSSQYVTSSGFTTESSPYWQLIARQVDSDNFTDGTHELFSSNVKSTYLQNDNDSSSSTFMSIGNLTKSSYADTDGKYKFKLLWDGMQVDSLDNKSVTWTQTSWLNNTTITGFEEIGVILPQAIPPMIPPLANYLITMFKETPLLAAITVVELFRAADQYSNSHYKYLEPMTLVGLFFLLVSIPSAFAALKLEKKFKTRNF